MVTKTKIERPQKLLYDYRRTSSYNGNVALITNQHVRTAGSVVSERNGDRNPYFARQIAFGENATTAMTAVERHVSINPVLYHMLIDSPFLQARVAYDSYYAPVVPVVGSLPSISVADTAAAVRFYRKAWKELRAFQGATFLGEVTEALQMIKNPAKSLRKGIDRFISDVKKRSKGVRLPKGSRKRDRQIRRIIGNTYLEAVFGWLPLIGDVEKGLEAIHRLSGVVRPWAFITASGVQEAQNTSGAHTAVNVNGYGVSGREYTTYYTEAIVRYYGTVKVSESYGRPPAQSLFGFTLPDAAQAGWELLPWSFLIDYFTNIGDLIEAWTFPSGNLNWVSKVTRQLAKSTTTAYSDRSFQNIASLGGPGTKLLAFSSAISTSTAYRKDVNRYSSVGAPTVSFQWEIPGMDLKWLNIAALVAARKTPPR